MNMPGFIAEDAGSSVSVHDLAETGTYMGAGSLALTYCTIGPCERYLCGIEAGPYGLKPIWCYGRRRCCRGLGCVWWPCRFSFH